MNENERVRASYSNFIVAKSFSLSRRSHLAIHAQERRKSKFSADAIPAFSFKSKFFYRLMFSAHVWHFRVCKRESEKKRFVPVATSVLSYS